MCVLGNVYICVCVLYGEANLGLRKRIWSDGEKVEFLEKIVKAVFGYNAKLEYGGWEIELPSITVKNVNLDEDLLGILSSRIREGFYLDFSCLGKMDRYVDDDMEFPIGVLEVKLWKRE